MIDVREWLTQRNIGFTQQTTQANPTLYNGGIVIGTPPAPGSQFQNTAGVYALPTFDKRVNVGPVGIVIQNQYSPYNL